MNLKLFRLFFIFLPFGLSAQSVDSLQAVQKTDTVIVKSREALNEIEAATTLPPLSPSQAADTLAIVQKVTTTADSINRLVATPQQKIDEGIDRLESKTTDRYNSVASETNEGLSRVGINKSVDSAELGAVDGLPSGGVAVPTTDALLKDVLPEGVDTGAIQKAQGIVSESEQAVELTKKVGGEIQSIGQGDLANTENLSGMAEQKLMQTDALKTLETEAAAFEGLADPAVPEIDARALVEEQLKKEIVQVAMSQFSKQLEPLEASMDKVGKYKSKYKEVQSLRNQEWVKRTSLADKTFRERIVPGLTFQVIDGNYLIIDFVPLVSYLINTKWQTGASGLYRTNIAKKNKPGEVKYEVYGFGVFSGYRVWKSFWLYAEANRNMVEAHLPAAGGGVRNTDCDILFGIKKAYQFTRHVKGHAQVLYNFLYSEHISPYPKPWHLRFGFEWYLKPREKAAAE